MLLQVYENKFDFSLPKARRKGTLKEEDLDVINRWDDVSVFLSQKCERDNGHFSSF
jgi:hypothetical protein